MSWGHSPRLGGTIFVWGGHKQSFGGHGPGMPPVAPGLTRYNFNKAVTTQFLCAHVLFKVLAKHEKVLVNNRYIAASAAITLESY